ncbi:RidA family protein [Algisphaera agarilytica]|uniref:Enamine deaminase RidA (YjgF/YER057c/UK114 family) n=1 Tax=Algisphaera agarilytica TaxID=1385975 RepID=A0A7X0H309_9BACT|nr:RidA family protein [Algisphaera agarilytica]MBB6428352.1 enamine deaminase RidA (YjgF/YER057c/UK114 family) [Algisphaera agarilytica]
MSLQPKIQQLGLTLPPVPAAVANYRVTNESHFTLYISGQLPKTDDGSLLATGKVGGEVDLDTAKQCARQCVLNALSAIESELSGHLTGKFQQVVRVGVFVASTPEFTDQHLVADAASSLLQEVLGPKGNHARSAVGCVSLPLDAPVEIEMTVELFDDRFEMD